MSERGGNMSDECQVPGCRRPKRGQQDLCQSHRHRELYSPDGLNPDRPLRAVAGRWVCECGPLSEPVPIWDGIARECAKCRRAVLTDDRCGNTITERTEQ